MDESDLEILGYLVDALDTMGSAVGGRNRVSLVVRHRDGDEEARTDFVFTPAELESVLRAAVDAGQAVRGLALLRRVLLGSDV